jgi:hypothetical protein
LTLGVLVFNDGDERNLRRSQLCLKGGKHFDAAGNLDALPLTHPEQFGNPVVSDAKTPKVKQKKSVFSARFHAAPCFRMFE